MFCNLLEDKYWWANGKKIFFHTCDPRIDFRYLRTITQFRRKLILKKKTLLRIVVINITRWSNLLCQMSLEVSQLCLIFCPLFCNFNNNYNNNLNNHNNILNNRIFNWSGPSAWLGIMFRVVDCDLKFLRNTSLALQKCHFRE